MSAHLLRAEGASPSQKPMGQRTRRTSDQVVRRRRRACPQTDAHCNEATAPASSSLRTKSSSEAADARVVALATERQRAGGASRLLQLVRTRSERRWRQDCRLAPIALAPGACWSPGTEQATASRRLSVSRQERQSAGDGLDDARCSSSIAPVSRAPTVAPTSALAEQGNAESVSPTNWTGRCRVRSPSSPATEPWVELPLRRPLRSARRATAAGAHFAHGGPSELRRGPRAKSASATREPTAPHCPCRR
jgi:hypothetical protein